MAENHALTDRGSRVRAGGIAVKVAPVAIVALIGIGLFVRDDVGRWISSGESGRTFESPIVSPEAAAQMPPPAAAPSSRDAHSAITAGLQLAGIVASGRRGIAIIVDAGSGQKVYRVGESVRPGVILKEVLRDAVILDTGEVNERLALSTRDTSADAIPGAAHATAVPSEAMIAQPKPAPDASGVTFGQRLNLDREIGAHFALDESGGFRLQKTKRDSPYANMGLRAGDVLRRLNGVSLESPKQLMALYRQLNDGGQGEVEVLRDGRFEVLRYGGAK